MDYPWLKALHIIAVISFVGGMLVDAVVLAAVHRVSAAGDAGASAGIVGTVRRWDQGVTTPALFLVWILGIALAQEGAWLSSVWLQVKLVLVLLLSLLHGFLSATLRRLAQSGKVAGDAGFGHAVAILLTVAIIVALVAVKP